ncbi:MAG: IPT/TIG domain-containing protein, partial [Candidatus Acidiferrales bacterium]
MRHFLRAVIVLSCAFIGAAGALRAQGPAPTPVITSINPSNVAAGGPGFTLTVTGSNFAASSVVRLNGSNRTTVFAGPTQLMAMIFPGDITAPAQLGITVFNPSATSPGFTSNTVILAVGNPPPTLASAAPGFLAQGVGSVRMTLLGANFRPGATVVISPPLTSLGNSTGAVQATDIAIEGVQRVSGNLLIVEISLGPEATTGLRGVDVVNTDGSSTAGGLTFAGTTQPLRISAGSSLAAPLSVVTIAVTHPRDGTLVMQGDDLYGEAILAGTGSGTVAGEWLWDGNVTEQFVSVFAGGQRATLRTQRSFPTSFLGV